MNKLKYISLCFCALVFIGIQAHAQSNRLYSQYMFNGLVINPAYAGNQYQLSISALNRAQWTGITGAPVSQTFSAHYGNKERKMGLGLVANHDAIGIHNNTQVFGIYAYHLKLNNYSVSFGLQGGLESIHTNWNKLNVNDVDDPYLTGSVSEFKPNVGFGVFMYNEKGYVGFSIPTIIENRFHSSPTESSPRYYLLTAARIFSASTKLRIKPSFLVRYSQGLPVSYDISNTFIFNSRVFTGLSLRSGKSLAWLLELQLNENFRFGYAFDHSFNELSAYGTATHELMINYRINLTTRPCHTFY